MDTLISDTMLDAGRCFTEYESSWDSDLSRDCTAVLRELRLSHPIVIAHRRIRTAKMLNVQLAGRGESCKDALDYRTR